jgi:hypothetical protein
MAYITSEEVKEIRNEIKAAFPKTFKFSITREHYCKVNVALMASPLEIEGNLNRTFKNHKTIKRIIDSIVNKKNFDLSDSMTDYFHVGFYTHIQVGQWDKPYQVKK